MERRRLVSYRSEEKAAAAAGMYVWRAKALVTSVEKLAKVVWKGKEVMEEDVIEVASMQEPEFVQTVSSNKKKKEGKIDIPITDVEKECSCNRFRCNIYIKRNQKWLLQEWIKTDKWRIDVERK
ncbi:hypothetical protein HOY80DRAFT_1031678 [Tuber brumale]|nr:hypothetical protein HOY80DRAFT_1031678 [Tuber brumale]